MSSIKDKIDETLRYFIENEDIILGNKFEYEDGVVKFGVDLVENELDVTVHIPDGGSGSYKVTYGSSTKELVHDSVENAFKVIMDSFVQERDSALDGMDLDTDLLSPKTPAFSNIDWDTMQNNPYEQIDDGDIESKILFKHCLVVNALLGLHNGTYIKGSNTVRFCVNGSHMFEAALENYGIKGTELVTMQFEFAEDYCANQREPTLEFTDSVDVFTGAFSEQVVNIIRHFVTTRWKEYHEKTIPAMGHDDPKLRYFTELVRLEAKNSTVEDEVREAENVVIKEAILREKQHYAMALSLYFSKMDIKEALNRFHDLGGKLSDEALKVLEAQNTILKDTNFLLDVATYIMLRLVNSTEFCALCDTAIEVACTKYKPIICTHHKCMFGLIVQGHCSDIPITICPSNLHVDILSNPNICDMLISFTYSVASSSRASVVFDPFPDFLVGKDGVKPYQKIVDCLKKVPKISELQKHCKDEMMLKKFLGFETYELLTWILTYKRPSMMKLAKEKQFSVMNTDLQFIMMQDDPQKTLEFDKKREEFGSYYAFHGSGLENWHAIIRNGTSLQTTGAAYGPGIYMATNASTSMGYSRVGNFWPNSMFGSSSSVKCLAICEVVKAPQVPTIPNPYYVVNVPEVTVPRYFFIYTGSASTSADISGFEKQLHSYVKGQGDKK